MEKIIIFCEENGFGFSISRTSGGSQFTVFIHTKLLDGNDQEISKYSQSVYAEDAINMVIQKVKLLKTNSK